MARTKINKITKTFLSVNFGCRVNAAETNQWSQTFIDQGFIPTNKNPNIIFVNTCAVTKKGEKESLNKIKELNKKYPKAQIVATGCADFKKIEKIPNLQIVKNNQKEKILTKLKSNYSPKIGDKFSHTYRFILKVQSGCNQFCSYCIVPFRRSYLRSLPIKDAVNTVNQASKNGYQEVIVTGVNLDQYKYGFSDLIEALLKQSNIKLISFGSIPINCIDDKLVKLFLTFNSRLSNFLHIPIQSGSDKILKLMNRPYTTKDIEEKFNKLKKMIPHFTKKDDKRKLKFGTDIIVGFPTESDKDFQDTLNLCKKIGFTKIHCFRYSPRPNTKARILFENSPKISKETLKQRSQKIRNNQKNHLPK